MPFQEEGSDERQPTRLFDRHLLRNYLSFGKGALRRRKGLAASVFLGMIGAAALGLAVMPRTYHVESKLFAQRNQVLAVRGDGPDAVAPTRGAVEIMERTENLVAVIESTDLVEHYRAHRAPAVRALDTLSGLLSTRVETEEDRVDAMVELLEKKLTVWTNEGTVTIALDWPDPEMACRLVNAIQQNFLETRYSQEITALAEASAIVGSHAARLSADVDEAVATIERLRAEPPAGARASAPSDGPVAAHSVLVPLRPPRSVDPAPELSGATVTMAAKQRAYDDLEDSRRRRLSEVKARLAEQRTMYTDSHPTVVESRQALAALSKESPEARALTQEIAILRADSAAASARDALYDESPGRSFVLAPATPGRPRPARDTARIEEALADDRAPATVYARDHLRDAMEKYSALRAQVQSAEIDLQTAEAAFKYRYGILTPAHLPKGPVKPSPLMVLFAAVLVGALLAISAAVAADLRAGKLLERWQVERLTDRPVLGELTVPDPSSQATM